MKKYLYLSILLFALAGSKAYAQQQNGYVDTTMAPSNHELIDENMVQSAKQDTTVAWNAVCPVMGRKVNPKVKLEVYNGKAYGFCCAGCDAKFAKDPAKYSKNLNEDGTRFTGKK